MDKDEEEQQWMKSVQESNNKAAYQALYNRYKTPVLSYFCYRLKDQSLAEELFQEVFLKLFRFRDSYDASRKFSSWFWMIAKNTLFDHLRKTQRSIDIIEEHVEAQENSANNLEEGTEWSNPELEALKNAELKQIDALLRSIKEKDRNIFLLRIFSEQRFEEIAEVYNVAPSSIRVSFHRTKKYLMENLNIEVSNYEKRQ